MITIIRFNVSNPKKKDVDAFRKLLIKLDVKCEHIEAPKKLKGRKEHLVVYDEVGDLLICQNCNNHKVKYKEWSPDGPPYFFCTKKCFKEFKRKPHLPYRATPLEKLK